MLLPLSWLKEYTDVDVNPVEFSNRITDSGSHVDSIQTLGRPVSGIVTGYVEKISPHPNADRLVVVTVNTGDAVHEIVTGAKNVVEGVYVPVALDGAVLADGTKIGTTDFRGVTSAGMLCSLEELGITDSVIPKPFVDGIFLAKEGTPGEPFAQVIGSDEPVIEIEVTPNRPDCLSIIGMARESAATFEEELRLPGGAEKSSDGDISSYLKDIRIESDRCLRYMGRVIHDVTIEPSPQWMQNRLMQAGMRPINNIVDITNYVMLEMGYPLHAFDIDTVQDQTIVVRQARPDEELLLLNGTTRKLSEEDLLIADAVEAIGLAGVMGGFDSEITDKTKNILIECAVFDKESIRKTAKRHGLRSEASSRFEKGLTPALVPAVMDRVCQLAEEIGVGTVISGSLDRNRENPPQIEIEADVDRINALLGTELSAKQMADYLTRLFFETEIHGHVLKAKVPVHRSDVTIPADIAEEIGRLHGFSNIEPRPIRGALSEGGKLPIRQIEDHARRILYALGFSEALTYSFISDKGYDRLQVPKEDTLRDVLRLMNPLGEDYSVMRTTLLPNMLDVLHFNLKNGQETLRMYELGNTFFPRSGDLPEERRSLAIGMTGNTDFYKMKGAVEALLEALGIHDLRVRPAEDIPWLHPGRAAYLYAGDRNIGSFGEISYAVAEGLDQAERVYLGEFDFEEIAKLYQSERLYTPIHKYPSMKRDLALVVDRQLTAQQVEDVLRTVDDPIVRSIRLFDVYEGPQVPEGKKSLAFEITYQDPKQTLKEEDAARVHAALREKAEEELGAALRA